MDYLVLKMLQQQQQHIQCNNPQVGFGEGDVYTTISFLKKVERLFSIDH